MENTDKDNTDTSSSYIDLRMCQTLLDKYKAELRRQREEQQQQQQQQQEEVADESTGTPSSDVQAASPAPDDGVAHCDDTPGTSPAAATATAADRQQYVEWETMQQMSKEAAMNGSVDSVNRQRDAAVNNDEPPTSTATVAEQPVYATVRKINGSQKPVAATLSAPAVTTSDDLVVYSTLLSATDCSSDQPQNNVEDSGIAATSSEGSHSSPDLQTQNDNEHTKMKTSEAVKNHVIVTSDGVAVPVRFVVRLVGSFPMSDGDRDASSKFVRRNVRRLSERKHSVDHPPSNTVFYWPTDVDIILELSGKLLRLIDASKGSELISQRLSSVRQWSTGPDANSRHFAYVSPVPEGTRFACHVFRCCGDCRADDVASTLRRVCFEIMQLRRAQEDTKL